MIKNISKYLFFKIHFITYIYLGIPTKDLLSTQTVYGLGIKRMVTE